MAPDSTSVDAPTSISIASPVSISIDVSVSLPNIYAAKSDKSRGKSVKSLAKEIKDHEDALAKEGPKSQDYNKHKGEVEIFKRNIAKELEKMGPKARGQIEKELEDLGIDLPK